MTGAFFMKIWYAVRNQSTGIEMKYTGGSGEITVASSVFFDTLLDFSEEKNFKIVCHH